MYFRRTFPHDKSDPRRIGFEVGQRIIGLYLSEMLLKYALDEIDVKYRNTHNLNSLYSKLPYDKKKRAKEKYKELLHNRYEWTWSFARTLNPFLKYLGENPIKDSRYFWKKNYSSRPHLLSPRNLNTLVYSLLIALHNYPQKSPVIEKRYETQFVDFEKSLANHINNNGRKTQETNSLKVHWLEGLLDYYNVEFPYESEDPRMLGFSVGRQIIGLYLVELLLKYALDDLNTNYRNDHDLESLFAALLPELRDQAEKKYTEIQSGFTRKAWEFERSIESLLRYYGRDAITESRYFWEPPIHRVCHSSIEFSRWTLYALIYALFIALHDYPERVDENRPRFKTVFVQFNPPNK